MPIPLPDLDDRTYAELADEARALIPHLLPEWTDHNPSDPGMVLVELLAWLTEMLLFQVNEIPEASTDGFLKLLNGRDWSRPPKVGIDEAVQRTMLQLRERYRAVTTGDYEHLCRSDWSATSAAAALGDPGIVARVRAIPRRNLAATDAGEREDPAPGHVSLVVVPRAGGGDDARHPRPTDQLRELLGDWFAPRSMLTTRLHVVGPSYVDVSLTATLALHEGASPPAVFAQVRRALATFLDPLTGGDDGTGWPFGRDVHASEVYAVLEKVPLVDFIEDVELAGPDLIPAVRIVAAGDAGSEEGSGSGGSGDGGADDSDDGGPAPAAGVRLDVDALVRLTTVGLAAYDAGGKRHPDRGFDVGPAEVPVAPLAIVAPAPEADTGDPVTAVPPVVGGGG